MEDQKQLEVVNFNNIDNEDFNGMWGGVQGGTYFVPAKTVKKFPRFLADHFKKALAVKILMKENKDFGNDSPLLADKMAQIVTEDPELPSVVMPEEPKKKPEFEEVKYLPTEPVKAPELPVEPVIEAKGYVCSTCQKTFKNALGLAGHSRSHKA